MAGRRIGWIDWVRALGACAIVLLHCMISTRLYAVLETPRLFVYMVAEIALCRWAVPAFFMLSGLLLLDPDRPLTWEDTRRHVTRMLVVLMTFGVVFALMEETWNAYAAGAPLGVGLLVRAVVDVVRMRSWDHLWYVYALLGVYLLAPLLRQVIERVGDRGFAVLTAILVCAFLAVPLAVGVTVPNVCVGVACFCVGGCLRDMRLGPAAVCAGVGSVAFMEWASIRGFYAGGVRSDLFLQGSCFAALYAVLVMLTVRRLAGDEPLAEGSLAGRLSEDSFGIYLIHPLFIHLVLRLVDPLSFPPVVYEVVLFLLVLSVSAASTRLLRRVPVFRGVL